MDSLAGSMPHCAHIIGPSAGTQVALGRCVCGHVDNWGMGRSHATIQKKSEVEGCQAPLVEDVRWLYARGESLLLLAPESH
jgi:hypothetical protein